MKQNPPTAKSLALLMHLAILPIALSLEACITRTQPTSLVSSGVQLNAPAPKTKPAKVVNINTAPSQELEKLPGIGKVIADRIVAHREQYGPFRRVEHVMMVRGISDRKFRELRAMIVVE